MKLIPFAFLLLAGCNMTPAEKATLEANLAKDGAAALQGALATGSWQGATLAAGAQVVRNHPELTSAKQPVKSVIP